MSERLNTFQVTDVDASCSPPDIRGARRFSMTVINEALQRIGPQVIPHVVERLAGQIAHEQRGAVEDAVHTYLRDRTWAEPIIKDALREAVHCYVFSMFREDRPQ